MSYMHLIHLYIIVLVTYVLYAALEIVFESVQQKHLDKTIFDQQVVNFVRKNKLISQTHTVPI